GELSTSGSITQNYRYSSQGQENQRETKWSSYRWRNYDAAMGRFFNVDPLSEKYAYQSHYNFSENRVVDNVELEGLEGEDFRFRMAMKQKGGVQWSAEKANQEANSAAFMAVIKLVTPIEELYTIATGRDLDGNPASRKDAGKLLALNLVPQAKVEVKAAATVLKAEAKAEAKAITKAAKKLYSKSRPSYGKDQVEEVWESGKQKDNKVYDPNTGEELTWDKTIKPRSWDMGHKPGHEYRNLHRDYMDGKISKEKFLEEYRNAKNYQPESKSANRSHKYEKK
ncbi:HNH/ENDO VII family nuclease, partial [Chryseobacterium rhizosphaerae]